LEFEKDRHVANMPVWLMRRLLSAFLGLFVLTGLGGIAAAGSADAVAFDLVIQGHELSGSENTVRVHQGDRVELRWLSDESAAVHLHGYDIELHLHTNEMVVMAFEAEATGRFPVELHGGHGSGGAHGALLYLEVHPR
jgi:FtsP/CotA-like multicopper oxidase with cupredoxin domain